MLRFAPTRPARLATLLRRFGPPPPPPRRHFSNSWCYRGQYGAGASATGT